MTCPPRCFRTPSLFHRPFRLANPAPTLPFLATSNNVAWSRISLTSCRKPRRSPALACSCPKRTALQLYSARTAIHAQISVSSQRRPSPSTPATRCPASSEFPIFVRRNFSRLPYSAGRRSSTLVASTALFADAQHGERLSVRHRAGQFPPRPPFPYLFHS
jgi:hypothetical protein